MMTVIELPKEASLELCKKIFAKFHLNYVSFSAQLSIPKAFGRNFWKVIAHLVNLLCTRFILIYPDLFRERALFSAHQRHIATHY